MKFPLSIPMNNNSKFILQNHRKNDHHRVIRYHTYDIFIVYLFAFSYQVTL